MKLEELKSILNNRNSIDTRYISYKTVISNIKYLSQSHSNKCNVNVLYFLGANGYAEEHKKRFKGWKLTNLGESVINELNNMGN